MNVEAFFKRYTYDIDDDFLGGGGFGKVYKAYDNDRDEWVAIKISEVHRGQENLSLKKEVELASKIPDHRNVAYYKICYRFRHQHGTMDYGILQYYKIGNLSNLIIKEKLSTEQLQGIANGIIQGIGHLHRHDIIHQDLKSANILIAYNQVREEYVPKITDFGLSKKFDSTDRSFVNNSIVAGTLAYSAPEQMAGKEVRKNADLWSLGVILFELFTGKVPFVSTHPNPNSVEGRQELMNQIGTGKLPNTIEEIPQPYRQLIEKCIVVEQEKRLKSVKEGWAILQGGKATDEPLEYREVGERTHIIDEERLKEKNQKEEIKLVATPPIHEKIEKTNPQITPAKEVAPKQSTSRWPVALVGALLLLFGSYFIWSSSTSTKVDNPVVENTENSNTTDDAETEDIVPPPVIESDKTEDKKTKKEPEGTVVKTSGKETPKPETTRKSPEEKPETKTTSSPPVTPAPKPITKSADEIAWEKARSINTKDAYNHYIKNNRNGAYVEEAKARYMGKAKEGNSSVLPAVLSQLEKKMISISGGSFQMGCSEDKDSDCSANEQPAYQVKVSSFKLSKHEVTQAEWEEVMGNNPSSKKCSTCPVHNISYEEAEKFISQLNKRTKKRYRLPTEAEWEFAAKGGTKNRGGIYAGGSQVSSVAWFKDNASGGVQKVGTKKANELGLYDMSGNTWEWTAGCYAKSYSGAPNNGKAQTKGDCNAAVLRGGSYNFEAKNCRNTNRRRWDKTRKKSDFSFRLAR